MRILLSPEIEIQCPRICENRQFADFRRSQNRWTIRSTIRVWSKCSKMKSSPNILLLYLYLESFRKRLRRDLICPQLFRMMILAFTNKRKKKETSRGGAEFTNIERTKREFFVARSNAAKIIGGSQGSTI